MKIHVMDENISYRHRKHGGFAPGTKPGPGRTPIAKGGKPNPATIVREAMADRAMDVIQTVIDKALEGDLQACKLVLERLSPALRSIEHIGADGSQLPVLEVRSRTTVINAESTESGASSQGNTPKPENPNNKSE